MNGEFYTGPVASYCFGQHVYIQAVLIDPSGYVLSSSHER